jgi:hypothetical protein
MRLEHMSVQLRARSGLEAVELGMALVRRHAAAVWRPWLWLTLPLFALLNALAVAVDAVWLAGVLMWWLKPAFDRIPLFVLSRAVFGSVPTLRETAVAQLRWGGRTLLHALSWRRLSPARSLLMPIDLLEGAHGAQLSERRRVLGSAAYGTATLVTLVCLHFELALLAACVALIFMFVPFEYLPETARAAWSLVADQPPWWAQVGFNAFGWVAVSVIEPFFVGAGFGLYLNRRTQIEAWDIEIAFRRLRARLLSARAQPLALLLAAVLAGLLPMVAPARAQERDPPQRSVPMPEAQKPRPPTLPIVFGDAYADDRAFRKAADRAYQDPLLGAKRTVVTWEKRDTAKPEPARPKPVDPRDLSWLDKVGAGFALAAEWALWIILSIAVLLLLVTARRWLPWMRNLPIHRKPPLAEAEHEALVVPEHLPDDVPTAARRLWAQGQPRQALALLYRASVETLAARADVALPPGATEAQWLRASRRLPQAEDQSLFARMVRTWQYAAYAQRLPSTDDFEGLVSQLQQRFGWSG